MSGNYQKSGHKNTLKRDMLNAKYKPLENAGYFAMSCFINVNAQIYVQLIFGGWNGFPTFLVEKKTLAIT